MKKVIATIFATTLLSSFTVNAFAETTEDSVYEPTPVEEVVEENVDTLPPPSEEMIEQDPWFEASVDPDGDGSAVPTSQEKEQTWAVVDENGNTINIISCTQSYCGSGWIPTDFDGLVPTEFARVVLQSDYDPVTDSNKGGHWGQHNFESGTWTLESGSGTLVMPTDPNEDPVCIANCVFPPTEDDTPLEEGEPFLANTEDVGNDSVVAENVSVVRSGDYKVLLNGSVKNNKINIKFNKGALKIKIVAKRWTSPANPEKKVWNIRFDQKTKSYVFDVPSAYSDWKFFIKNDNKKIKRVYVS